ncbi:hypothetical protein C0Q70_06943 [Pomacea canaliculata]|uniref:CARD domain-containing protein n=1 Tax=Pomacea canaliculata TaxID=400727 RepID=A0A2T7PDP0_POMCA|nr:hypothetical protein C0Q70_06943 [Pomacea canaliculata]
MDERYRGTLQRYYRALIANITLTNELIEQIAKEKILPDAMIRDIQVKSEYGETREERNERLLNGLRLRGNNSFKRFRDLMFRTGNFFIADLLWEEDDNPSMLDIQDFRNFPGMLDCLQEEHKKKLVQYLESKVREKALMLSWRGSPADRIESLHARATDYTQEKILRETVMNQEETIKHQESTLLRKEEELQGLNLEVANLQKQVEQLRQDHRSFLDTHSRFHDANINTISKLRERTIRAKKSLHMLNQMMKAHLTKTREDFDVSNENIDDEAQIEELERNLATFLENLKKTEEASVSLRNEREEVLALLNRRTSNESLVVVVKDVLRHEQKHRFMVMKEILKLSDMLKSVQHGKKIASSPAIEPAMLDTKHFKAQLAMLKVEAEHLHKRLSWKDTEILSLRNEMTRQNSRLSDGFECEGSGAAPYVSLSREPSFQNPVSPSSPHFNATCSAPFPSSSDVTAKWVNSSCRQTSRTQQAKQQVSQKKLKSTLSTGCTEVNTKLSPNLVQRRRTTVSPVLTSRSSKSISPKTDGVFPDLDQTLVDVDLYLKQQSPWPSTDPIIETTQPGNVDESGCLN